MTFFPSSTQEIPGTGAIPRHIAVIMDGNGRWARKRMLPRVAGHKRGVDTLRDLTRNCVERGIDYLTVFAFSSENWRRPKQEVSVLQMLFVWALQHEVEKMHRNNVRMRVIGDLQSFGEKIAGLAAEGEALTAGNTGLTLTIAANYGGRWDLLQAVNQIALNRPPEAGPITEEELGSKLALCHTPEPDLFIRTGGERRISNFLLWQLAYTELYFTDTLWPDFDGEALDAAIAWYGERDRRFGQTEEQLRSKTSATTDNPKQTAA